MQTIHIEVAQPRDAPVDAQHVQSCQIRYFRTLAILTNRQAVEVAKQHRRFAWPPIAYVIDRHGHLVNSVDSPDTAVSECNRETRQWNMNVSARPYLLCTSLLGVFLGYQRSCAQGGFVREDTLVLSIRPFELYRNVGRIGRVVKAILVSGGLPLRVS
jgi:hypothetical protein